MVVTYVDIIEFGDLKLRGVYIGVVIEIDKTSCFEGGFTSCTIGNTTTFPNAKRRENLAYSRTYDFHLLLK